MSSSSKAGTRINALLDENSFVEIGARVTARSTDFNQKPAEAPSDGVITGYGTIDGGLVYVFSQDAAVLGGSVGEMHAKKIANLYDLAVRTGAPVIGLVDSTGLRLAEATDALNAIGEVYAKMAAASGVVPQITAIFGECGGGLSLIPAMTDFTFMAKDAKLFTASPNAIPGAAASDKDSASAAAKAAAGAVDFTASEDEVLAEIRQLVDILPCNNEKEAYCDEVSDDLNRASANVETGYTDPSVAVADLADDGLFIETAKDFAPEMATGFARLGGHTVGVIANRAEAFDENGEKTASYDTVLTTAGAEKAAKLVRFCDAFDIPVVTLTNVSGFARTAEEEKTVAAAAGRLAYAFADSDIAKINVITGSAVGSAYNVMNSKALGADITVALPTAKIGLIDAKFAAQVLAGDGDDKAEVEKKYAELQNSIDAAAAHGYIDEIVEPADLRKYLIGAVEVLTGKRTFVEKKHGTV